MHVPDVLVVDDDPDIRAMLGYTLGAEFNVRFASNGIDAIEQLATNPPDAMILDVMMPGLDGYDVLEARRERGLAPHTQVIMLTGKTDERRPRPLLGPRRRRLPLQAHRPGAASPRCSGSTSPPLPAPDPGRRHAAQPVPPARCTGWTAHRSLDPATSTRRLRVLIGGA